MGTLYTVNSKTFDRSIKRSWTAELVDQNTDFILLKGVFDQPVNHADLGEIAAGTISYEYFWPNRWYNVFRFHHPGGTFRNFYCNITLPPFIGDGLVEYVDLDIDILVDADGGFRVLDEDEFAENSEKYAYPLELIEAVPEVIDQIRRIIREHKFPFDKMQQSNS